jgi:hypothetical protein
MNSAAQKGLATAPAAVSSRQKVRFIGDVMGSYVLANRVQTSGGVTVFACRARSISAFEAVLNAPVSGNPGDGFTATLEGLGIVRGVITRTLPQGFAATFECSEAERELLGARIDWLKRKTLKTVSDRRIHKRVLPRETRSKLVLGDGRRFECFLIDMSQSGVAVSADVLPPLGALAGVGAVPGKVVRHLEAGFAVQFAQLQQLDQLEALLTLKTSENRVLAAERLGLN